MRALRAKFNSILPLALWVLSSGCSEVPSAVEPEPEPDPIPWGTPESLDTDAGRVTIHRLNNREFERTTQELLATELSVSFTLPKDPLAGGFDKQDSY